MEMTLVSRLSESGDRIRICHIKKIESVAGG